jgi:HEAT repeat protein
VFDALLNMEHGRAIAFVAEFLNSGSNELRDEAALALGAARLDGAVKVLIERWNSTRSGAFADVLLRAISSSRLPEALAFLIDLLKSDNPRQSAAAVEALKLHQDTPEIQALITDALRKQ